MPLLSDALELTSVFGILAAVIPILVHVLEKSLESQGKQTMGKAIGAAAGHSSPEFNRRAQSVADIMQFAYMFIVGLMLLAICVFLFLQKDMPDQFLRWCVAVFGAALLFLLVTTTFSFATYVKINRRIRSGKQEAIKNKEIARVRGGQY